MTRTFVDSSVLIAAARERAPDNEHSLRILADPTREFVSSVFVQLEVLPKARFNRKTAETDFYEAFFASVRSWADDLTIVTHLALREGSRLGLSAIDALHLAAAASVDADELVTLEGPSRPIYRTELVKITWVRKHGALS